MAYDPKKKRPSRDSLDAVVDEIFGEESNEAKKSKSTGTSKKTSSKASSTQSKKTPAAKKTPPAAAKKPASPQKKSTPVRETQESPVSFEKDETLDNVLPLYPESDNTPLIMQPQVWVATGIAALLILFIARGRKKH